MRRGRAAKILALAGVLWLLATHAALAADRPCAPIVVEVDAAVRDRWPKLAERVREAFDGREDIDACARVRLTVSGAAISVRVFLRDGRSAARLVPRRDDVIAMLEALLLVPIHPPAPEPKPEAGVAVPSAAPAVDVGAAPAGAATAGTPRDARTPTRAEVQDHLRIELSVATGARIGDGQAGFGLGALSFLDISGWLVGFEGRLDDYRELARDSNGGALSLGLLGGRRLPFRSIALDLVVGPALVYQGTSSATTRGGVAYGKFTEYRSGILPRLIVASRVNFGARSMLRTFIGVEGEVGPSGENEDSRRVDAPRLPIWTLGLALGATVGTL